MEIADEKFRASCASEERVWPGADNFFSGLPCILRHMCSPQPQH
ncbi:hypothetical protein CABS03_11454 [Colletotrichum abscissum]|uniref:Uncharacterized protein n=1 Tax=Colletotrichum abscissum TaxID=1671311 RepID=A0A9Q0B6D2_9PEZI|nr:hypothetical protein CABS02_00820 [Colletotrichum abscissum]